MKFKKLIKKHLVGKLPIKYQLIIERIYLDKFVKDYVEMEINVIKQLCNPGKISLDIGANRGVFTIFMSQYSSHVYCFEPIPWLCELLKEKFKGQNVSVRNYALGNENREKILNIPIDGVEKIDTRSSFIEDIFNDNILGIKVTEFQKLAVKVRKLDDLKINDIGFMKIDVEGFECEVIKGGKETIEREKPNIYIEIEQRYHKYRRIEDIFKYIESLGYYGYFILGNELINTDEYEVERMQDDLNEKSKEFVNNFIFTPHKIDVCLI